MNKIYNLETASVARIHVVAELVFTVISVIAVLIVLP